MRTGTQKGAGSDFNPRSPCGERPTATSTNNSSDWISIHAPRVGSDTVGDVDVGITGLISIHAPRVGSDLEAYRLELGMDISIHAPRVGSDILLSSLKTTALLFQSTLPVWGATG